MKGLLQPFQSGALRLCQFLHRDLRPLGHDACYVIGRDTHLAAGIVSLETLFLLLQLFLSLLLLLVEKGGLLINMDAQAPNHVFQEWAAQGGFLPDVQSIQPEYRYGDSRLDFALTTLSGLHLVEVKGVTLEENGVVRFPDAPTERGVKHIRELERAVREGTEATLFFVIQMCGVDHFSPNDITHPAFGAALREAAAAGVHIRAYDCVVAPDSLAIHRPVPVIL